MSVHVSDRPDRSRFEASIDGETAGFADYTRDGQTITFTHTEVDDGHEGEGVGSTLVRAALDSARERGLAVVPECAFVRGYIARHEEYLDLVPADRRGDHDL